jgi:hypothetical protein
MEVSDFVNIKALEDENRRLERIGADQTLNIGVLQMVPSGKSTVCTETSSRARRLVKNSTSANGKRAATFE